MPAVLHPSGMENRIAAARLKAARPVTGVGVHLLSVGADACRWVVGDARAQLVCGQPTEPGCSWCPDHKRMVWQ